MIMRPYFRPMLTPTLWIVPLLVILMSLGVWQIHRLHWKLDLLAKIHTGLTAPPVSLADVWGYGSDIGGGVGEQMSNADYRRVKITGRFLNSEEILFFTTGPDGAPVYHVITPFIVEHPWRDVQLCGVCVGEIRGPNGKVWKYKTNAHDVLMLVDRGYVPTDLPPSALAAGDLKGERDVVGIIRKPAAPGWFTPPINVEKRIVHTRDPAALAEAFGLHNIFPMFLEADATPNPSGWPKGGVTVVDLPNDHLQYAITWFGLALGLLAVYLAYHRSKGRLGLR
jgi:surfeit locus 1 family protein